MKPTELQELFEGIVDDTNLSQTFVFTLFTNSFNVIWLKRQWEIAKKSFDTTLAIGSSSLALPTDFLKPLPLYIGDNKIYPIKREDRRLFKDSADRYYVDWSTNTIKFTQPTSNTAVYLDYIFKAINPFTTALKGTDIATTVPGFIDTFHPLVAYEAAKFFYFQEVGSKSDSWTGEMQAEYDRLFNLMCSWDADLKTAAQNTSIPEIISHNNRSNVIELD